MKIDFNILPDLGKKAEKKWKKFFSKHGFHPSRRLIWGLSLGIGVPLYLIGLIIFAWYSNVQAVIDYAKEADSSVKAAQSHLMNQKFRTALADLSQVSVNLEGLRVSLSIIPDYIKKLPIVETQVSAVGFMVESSSQLVDAMKTLTQLSANILEPFLKNPKLSLEKLPDNVRRELLKRVYESPPVLAGIRAQIGLADAALSQIPQHGVLKSIQEKIDPLREKLPQVSEAIDSAVPLAELLPQLAGYPVPKTYLFLLQNNTELRPTGGFLGAYGIMRLKDGNIDSFTTDNSYNLDVRVKDALKVVPPSPLQKYNDTTQWFFRDSNWSPDFPTAAKQAMWFYGKEGGSAKPDGVIAITPVVIARLLEMTGPIKIDGVEFTKDNVVDELIYQVEKAYTWQGKSFENRKGVIGDLAQELLRKIYALPRDKWPELFAAMGETAKEKHILLYSTNDELQKKIIDAGWDGRIPESSGDYLAVFDANLASLKTDAVMKRYLSYKIESMNDGSLVASVTLKYANLAEKIDWRTSRYRNYVRILVPLGSELIDSQGTMANDRTTRKGAVDVSEDFGKTVFGTFVAIEPKETRELTMRYKLPDWIKEKIARKDYSLMIQKQPGIDSRELDIKLKFFKPIDNAIWLDSQQKISDNTVTISGDLKYDQTLTVRLK